MSDTNFYHDYVPPSKRPKPPTPPPQPKETNPWLISPPTNPDGATASTGPVPAPAPENNPWLVGAPSTNQAAEPAESAVAGSPSPAGSPPPAPPPSPQSVPAFVYAAFPAIPVNNAQTQPHGQLYFSGAPVPVLNQQPFWFTNAARNAAAVAPVQVGIATQHVQAPTFVAPAPMPQVSGPLNMPIEYYCRELDGGYTLRTREQIATMTGEWAQSAIGFPYFVRTW